MTKVNEFTPKGTLSFYTPNSILHILSFITPYLVSPGHCIKEYISPIIYNSKIEDFQLIVTNIKTNLSVI